MVWLRYGLYQLSSKYLLDRHGTQRVLALGLLADLPIHSDTKDPLERDRHAGHCQPWTAICEMQRAEEELNEVRGRYLNKIRAMSVVELIEDIEMSEFISRAGRVRFR